MLQDALAVVFFFAADFHQADTEGAAHLREVNVQNIAEAAVAQVLPGGVGPADAADLAALAGRKLAQERLVNRLRAHGDALHLHEPGVVALRHVAGEFAEGAFHLLLGRAHPAFHDDLRLGRHQQVAGLALHQLDGVAGQTAGDVVLADVIRQPGDGGVGDGRWHADHHGGRHLLDAALQPHLDVAAHAEARRGGIDADAILGLQHAAVVADVVQFEVRVGAYPVGGGGIGGVVEAGCGDRYRQAGQAALLEIIAAQHHLLHRSGVDQLRRDRVGLGVLPAQRNLFRFAHQSLGVDLAGTGHGAERQRHVEGAALGVGDIAEQPRLAVFLFQTAELQAHQRVHLGVLVDLAVDLHQQAGALQRLQVLVQVAVIVVWWWQAVFVGHGSGFSFPRSGGTRRQPAGNRSR